MHKSNEDCFYFLTSSCAKGSSCTYRHSPLALTCNVICPAWLRGNCLEPACVFRHTTVQRPMISNGILCFYENTPMGCLKPDCTFIHSRPRMNSRPTIRPSLTNLINKDAAKPIVTNTPPTDVSSANINLDETQPIISIPTLEPSPIVKTETSRIEESNNNKSSTRSVITDSPKEITTTQPRLVVNRNVVMSESTSPPNRKILPSTSNRVVVSSTSTSSPSKEKKNDRDLVEQENNAKKFKRESQSTTDTSSTTLITNRLLLTSEKDTKPIRLNRHRSPATKTLSGNSPKSSNEEKTSAGTELSQDDERRTMRIERFQKKTISPPRSIIRSSPITTTNNTSTARNVITSSHNERKRTAPETTAKGAPPPKRVLTQSSRHRQSSSTHDKNWKNQTDEFISKTARQKNSPPRPALSSVVHSRFAPKPIVPPSSSSRSRQPPSVVIKRPLIPVATPSKPIEKISSQPTADRQTSNLPNEEDENQLLKLNESADVVDTFALIDEALLEADHLLELM